MAWVSSPLVTADEPTVEARAELEILAMDLLEEEGDEVEVFFLLAVRGAGEVKTGTSSGAREPSKSALTEEEATLEKGMGGYDVGSYFSSQSRTLRGVLLPC